MSARRMFQIAFGAVGLILGFYTGLRLVSVANEFNAPVFVLQRPWLVMLAATIIPGFIGFIAGPSIIQRIKLCAEWIQGRLVRIPALDIIAGATGLIIGLIIGYLLRPVLQPLPLIGDYLPTAVSLLLGYLGWVVMMNKRDDLFTILQGLPGRRDRDAVEGSSYKILDTSAIIDGRISDICKAGFLDGTLIIPSFVLDELRHIADSSDILKRSKGRRGLDILNRMQKELDLPVRIYERDISDTEEVDVKLVKLAKKLNGKIVTNDFNLNKVAGIQGIPVLNVNELANAVKPLVIPGEEMYVQVLKEGKETGQGVAYLDDGTMIVVDGGRRHIGEKVWVEVTSVLQTAAGRMIFAKPKQPVSDIRAAATNP